MSCKHKFHEWLYLPKSKVTWKVEKLIVGTFNPEWEEPGKISADWFYGRTGNNYLWQILPEMFGEVSLLKSNNKINDWTSFCKKFNIGFTDLIEEITSADIGNPIHKKALIGDNFSDTSILKTFKEENDIKWTNIKKILVTHESIKEVYLTNSDAKIWGKKFMEAKKFAVENPHRKLSVIKLYTPSKEARFWMKSKGFNNLPDFIKHEWTTRGFNFKKCTDIN